MLITNRERFADVLNFRPVDRLPAIEWATWWDKTLARWYEEGLPEDLSEPVIYSQSDQCSLASTSLFKKIDGLTTYVLDMIDAW